MFVLMGFRKNRDTIAIAASKDRNELKEIAKKLDPVVGLRDPSEGIWDRQEIKGMFWIVDIGNDGYQRGVDFFNYKLQE